MKYKKKNIINTNKKLVIKELFDDVSNKYDLMNDLMSFGLHRIWKKSLIRNLKNEKAYTITI